MDVRLIKLIMEEKLAPNFDWWEMEQSRTAATLQIDNSIPNVVKPYTKWFVSKVLQPIRNT